jgi:hypothetical protein
VFNLIKLISLSTSSLHPKCLVTILVWTASPNYSVWRARWCLSMFIFIAERLSRPIPNSLSFCDGSRVSQPVNELSSKKVGAASISHNDSSSTRVSAFGWFQNGCQTSVATLCCFQSQKMLLYLDFREGNLEQSTEKVTFRPYTLVANQPKGDTRV